MRVGARRGWSDPKSHRFGSLQKRTPWLNREMLSYRWCLPTTDPRAIRRDGWVCKSPAQQGYGGRDRV
jgi:hypothetical protein